MIKVELTLENSDIKILDVDSPTFEKAKARVLRYYPNAKNIAWIKTIEDLILDIINGKM